VRRPSPETGLQPSEIKIWRDAAYRDDVNGKAWPLGIRPRDLLTVAVVSRAITKLCARDRAQLVVLAYEHGLAARPAM
jgi:hypothetical protein